MSNEIWPEYVRPLPSGVQPVDDDMAPHLLVLEDVERQMREMELARAAATVSCRDYMITS